LPPMSEWVFEISDSQAGSLDATLSELLDFLLPFKEALRIAVSRHPACVRVVVADRDFVGPYDKDISIRAGQIDLAPNVIEKLGQFGLGLTVNLIPGRDAHH